MKQEIQQKTVELHYSQTEAEQIFSESSCLLAMTKESSEYKFLFKWKEYYQSTLYWGRKEKKKAIHT